VALVLANARPMQRIAFGDLAFDAVERIERGQRLLRD
jgi:hypothetical protein